MDLSYFIFNFYEKNPEKILQTKNFKFNNQLEYIFKLFDRYYIIIKNNKYIDQTPINIFENGWVYTIYMSSYIDRNSGRIPISNIKADFPISGRYSHNNINTQRKFLIDFLLYN